VRNSSARISKAFRTVTITSLCSHQ